jgi:hypothetical protein
LREKALDESDQRLKLITTLWHLIY